MPTAKTLLPAPYLTLEDENGHTVIGGTVTFLDTGTALLATVYADANGLVISANPLTVDGAGRYSVWLTPGQVVDVEYRDALGAVITTVPGVMAVPTEGGNVDTRGTLGESVVAGQVVYLSNGANGRTSGLWYLATGTDRDLSELPTVGIATEAGVSGATVVIRTAGHLGGYAGLVVGRYYFVGNTPGALSLTSGVHPRLLGQSNTPTELLFWGNPPPLVPPSIVVAGTTAGVIVGGVVPQVLAQAPTLQFRNTAVVTLQGIEAGYDGQRIRLLATDAQVDLVHLSGAALPADRLQHLVTSAPISIVTGGSADYEYDSLTATWRLIAHEQGGWITPVFDATDYFAAGGMTWQVVSGNVGRCAYYLRGKILRVQQHVTNSMVGGTPSNLLLRRVPGGYRLTGSPFGTIATSTAAGSSGAGCWSNSATEIQFRLEVTAATLWPLGNTWVMADMTLEPV